VNTWHWTESFTIFFSNRKCYQPQLLPHFLPYSLPRGGLFFRNAVIIRCVNYTILLYNIVIKCIKNNAVINNNYGRLQDLILLLKVPMGTRQNFEICRRVLGKVHQPWSKTWVYGRSLAEIAGSNADGGNVMCLLWVLCVLSDRGLCDGPITCPVESYRVWSGNLDKKEA